MARLGKSEVLHNTALGLVGLLTSLPAEREMGTAEIEEQLRRLVTYGPEQETDRQPLRAEVAFAVFGACVTLKSVGVEMGPHELAQVMLDEVAAARDRFAKTLTSMMMLGMELTEGGD